MRRLLPTLLLLPLLGLGGCGRGDGPEPGAGAAEAQALAAERAALEATEAQVAADREAVRGFDIIRATYAYAPDPRTGQPAPSVELVLANGTKLTVARLSVRAEFTREGETAPWWGQEFHFPVSGVMAPGDEATARLSPEPDTDWALRAPAAEVPVQARVLPVALETPEGKRYLTEHAVGPAQQARLAELRAAR
ncbi:hypothetical protein K3217_16635 [bacterium BD-1]|uniref:hypothetical protein n=1 Tax=Arenimonas sp. TaxID=1872635 RepID=UPI001E2C3F33|nr:hypothetical protein [Ottowia caeni]